MDSTSPAGLMLHFGPRNLPPALTLSLYAAANVVVISFVPAVLFTGDRRRATDAAYPRLAAPWLAAAGRSPAVRGAAGALGVAALVAAAVAGGYGLWVGLWVGVLAGGLVGNLWKLLNPWSALFGLLTGGRPRPARLRLPGWLGAWPAAAGYLGFAAAAMAQPGSGWARAALVAGYTALTLAGMALFGRDEWLGRCEGVTVLFDVAGRFGPVEAERDADGRVERVWLRPWGSGLLRPGAAGWDHVAFVMVVLGTLAFDGLRTAGALPSSPAGAATAGAGSLLLAVAFLLAFAALARGMRLLAGARAGDAAAVTAFAETLVPIGLLYAAAHFASALFGRPEAGPVLTGTDTIWFVQVTAVLAGHAIAVHLAHRHAGERFQSAQRAALSQYPILVALVLYTMTSLWILAQPLTNG
jgi:hypothetical protein